MSTLPEEIYLEILLRIPVKFTYVCKCVCKSWFKLISDVNFAKMHLNLSFQNKNCDLMLVKLRESGNDRIYTIGHDSLESLLSDEFHTYALRRNYPWGFFFVNEINLLGSCNGLVCLLLVEYGMYCLWNPATTEYQIIPDPSDIDDPPNFSICAFGYDCKTEDYKLVVGEDDCYDQSDYKSVVQFYTRSSNSWKSSQTIPYRFHVGQGVRGALVHGHYHWLARVQGDSEVLVSLDIGEEVFLELQLPKEFLKNKHLCRSVGVLEGCLCLLVDVMNAQFEIWVMQSYGVRESWTRRCVITHERILKNIPVRFICSLKSGNMLFYVCDDLVIYDPKNRSVIERKIPSSYFSDYQEACYFESLVSLGSGTYVGSRRNKNR